MSSLPLAEFPLSLYVTVEKRYDSSNGCFAGDRKVVRSCHGMSESSSQPRCQELLSDLYIALRTVGYIAKPGKRWALMLTGIKSHMVVQRGVNRSFSYIK